MLSHLSSPVPKDFLIIIKDKKQSCCYARTVFFMSLYAVFYVLELGNLEASLMAGGGVSLSVCKLEKVKQIIFFLSHEVN